MLKLRSVLRVARRVPAPRADVLPLRCPAWTGRPPIVRTATRALCMQQPPAAGTVNDEPAVRDASASAFLASESATYGRFVNMIMQDGKKATARKLLWETFTRLREGGHEPQEVFYGALENVRPMMEMRTFRSGPVPFPLNPKRAEGQAMKWIIAAARKRAGTSFDRRLAQELLAAHQRKGAAVQKREEVHKMAVANQAAAHFRWRVGTSRVAGAIDMQRKQHRPLARRSIKRWQGLMPPVREEAPSAELSPESRRGGRRGEAPWGLGARSARS